MGDEAFKVGDGMSNVIHMRRTFSIRFGRGVGSGGCWSAQIADEILPHWTLAPRST